ncbi:Transcriptional regulator [hydrothermal vent metagenome]|uniref:Transcriptional regulator n=1 Tax=hydrothermal vent metagenome TaxID=652676 RepID=A0A3B0YU77_9ZZZZ
MHNKRTMTINLNDNEMSILEAICSKKGLSKTALVRQALRLYQSIDTRIDDGEKLFLENPVTKEKSELMVL